MESEINEVFDKFFQYIDQGYLSSKKELKSVDVGTIISYFTLDAVTKIAFGEAFNFLGEHRDLFNFQRMSRRTLPLIMLIGAVPFQLYKVLLPIIGPKLTDSTGVVPAIAIAKEIVKGHFNFETKDRSDMLDSWIRHGFSDRRRMQGEVLFQTIAGSDTTAGAIRAFMLHIITNSRVLRKLREEIDAAAREGRISQPISTAEAQQLPYVQAVIREGLRIYPPVSSMFMKRVPDGGEVIDGKFVPEGTGIGHNTWPLQRDTLVFGADSEMFRPERWIEAGSEKRQDMKRVVELVFGYGRWVCMGKIVALLELEKFAVEVRIFAAAAIVLFSDSL